LRAIARSRARGRMHAPPDGPAGLIRSSSAVYALTIDDCGVRSGERPGLGGRMGDGQDRSITHLPHPLTPFCSLPSPSPYHQMCSLKWNDDIANPVIYSEISGDWLSLTTANGFPRQ